MGNNEIGVSINSFKNLLDNFYSDKLFIVP